MQVCQYSMDVLLDGLPGAKESKEHIRSHGRHFDTHRAMFGYPNDSHPKANPWVSLIEPHLRKFNELHRLIIFGTEYDGTLKLALRAAKSASEAMAEGTIAEKLAEIQEMARQNDVETIIMQDMV